MEETRYGLRVRVSSLSSQRWHLSQPSASWARTRHSETSASRPTNGFEERWRH